MIKNRRKSMSHQSRREFFRNAGLGVAAGALVHTASSCASKVKEEGGVDTLKLGIASYTFRKFDLDQTLAMTNRLNVKNIAFKSFHLPLDASPELIRETVEKTKAAGLNLYACGVIYMNSKEEADQAFDYAKAAGVGTIVGVPAFNLLDYVEQKIKEYDIKVAIHNHGPGDQLFPAPGDVYDKIKDRDQRFGLCLDIGHTQRIGLNPAEEAKKYFDRLYDVHIKDVSSSTAEGTTVEVGRGVIDIPGFLKALEDLGYPYVVSLEYEKDENDPLPGSAESIGYIRGVMAVI